MVATSIGINSHEEIIFVVMSLDDKIKIPRFERRVKLKLIVAVDPWIHASEFTFFII